MKVVIIGGGLLGLLTARELALAGQEVSVVEQGEIGAESSWAGGGILSPLYPWEYAAPVNALARWSQQHYPALAEDLAQNSDVDPQWTQNGLLVLDEEKFDVAENWAVEYGLQSSRLDPRALQASEPELVIGNHSGLLFPEIAQVRNPRMIKSTLQACQSLGVSIYPLTEVKSLIINHNIVQGVRTEQSDILADRVVVCAGAWSGRLLEAQGVQKVEVKPMRGQMIMFHGQPGLLRHITLFKGHYVIPRRDGRILVGSTLEDAGFDKSITQTAAQELSQFALQLFPALNDCAVERQWSGLRPATEHGIPYICSVPGLENLFLNTGHFRNGVILGPASARLLADLLLKRPPEIDPEPYALNQQH